jgi:hypothetical protein
MNISVSSPLGNTGETALQREQQLFWELSSRLIDAFLNRMFDLRPAKAARRMWYLIILFFATMFLVSLRFYPLGLWAKFIQDIFLYSLNPAYAATYVGNPYTNFLAFVTQVFTDPRIFQYLPVFLAPFFIALQCAALYLADVFELEHVSVARAYIWSVALSGSQETIRVSQGDITEEGRESPTFLIGGPGKVMVDLDSVALFEKSDGTPHIIGPTVKESRSRATLEGFERFRQAIDIRDHYVDLRDQNSKSESVKSRSLDGIPIEATDVRFMFSIYRGGTKSGIEHPYPFSTRAVEDLVYKATSRVTPGQTNPSAFEFSWVFNMIGLIRGRLSGFMSEHRLTSYLASIGIPELEKLKQREEMIVEQVQEFTQSESENDFLVPKQKKSLPEFQARYKIKNLFSQFAEEFTKRAQSGGVELHWIGVGTWKVPTEIVPETKIVPDEHLEAWKLSNENLYRENSEVLDKLEKEAIIQKMIVLIQDVPITGYLRVVGAENEQKKAMRSLIQDYRQQLLEAVEFMRAKGEAIPPNIEEAITHINNTLYHFI